MPLGTEVDLVPGHIVLDGDPAPHRPKKGHSAPIFGSCLLWPNGQRDQDATWYGGRPRPMPHCAGCGPSSPDGKGYSSRLFWPHSIVAKRSSISATDEVLFKVLIVSAETT